MPSEEYKETTRSIDDDAAEAGGKADANDNSGRKKQRGQNKARDFGSSRDEKGLCSTRATYPEFSPSACTYGDKCRFEHDLRKYLSDYKRSDLQTFNGKCPVYTAKGWCDLGWKCRFVGSHSAERTTADGRQELHLLQEVGEVRNIPDGVAIVNTTATDVRNRLMKRQYPTPKTDRYLEWMNQSRDDLPDDEQERHERRAAYKEPPFRPSEKRKVYIGPETPLLAPLTTQGNQPFRRLCVNLGAQITYSEMAMSLPLIQGQKSEWALMRAHEDEIKPPTFASKGQVQQGYDNNKDLRFGAQIAGHKPWMALKATEILANACSHLRVIDLNCGCPIDLVCRSGGGSQLLDSPGKLEKILKGMNAVSGDIPITVKIRMGTKDAKPTAAKLVDRLVYGSKETLAVEDTTSGVAAITLHGRSKQQRYTRSADWEYISGCAALINRHREKGDKLSDTVRENEGQDNASAKKVYFIGNGDCYSHVDYYEHLDKANVDSVMIGRGALIKPWIFEEIEKGQYLDKTSSERLGYIEQFCRYGLEAWGSDEMGIGTTRRFLLEWLNFTHRYVPVGILEHLPPNIQDRPPRWRGRDELETLMASDNYKDWIKIRYNFSCCDYSFANDVQ